MLNLDEKKLLFEKKGFIILENLLHTKTAYTNFDQVKKEVYHSYGSNYDKIKLLSGFITGNLDLKPSKVILRVWEDLKEQGISEVIKKLTNKSLNDFDLKYAGNISLPKKGNQFYHTDGTKRPRKILIGVPIEDLNEIDGPTELIPGSHIHKISYWKFHLEKFFKKKIKLVLKKGDIFIRESYIWHKGTKNNSTKLRIIILFILSEKNENYSRQEILNNVEFGDNMFEVSLYGKIKEMISVYLPFFYFVYKFFISIIRK